MSQSPPEEQATQIAVTALQGWEQDVDAVQRARLAAARRRALSPVAPRRAPLAWGGALAAGLMLALGIGFWPQLHAPREADATLLQATLEEADLDAPEAHAAELLLDDDLDFYLWLDASAGTAEST